MNKRKKARCEAALSGSVSASIVVSSGDPKAHRTAARTASVA